MFGMGGMSSAEQQELEALLKALDLPDVTRRNGLTFVEGRKIPTDVPEPEAELKETVRILEYKVHLLYRILRLLVEKTVLLEEACGDVSDG